MRSRSGRLILIVAIVAIVLVPVGAIAGAGFSDVADDSVFVDDIQWLANAGITMGCNPPVNDEFCPKEAVTREQMAAFMHRLAIGRNVDAATVEGMTASDLVGQTGPAGLTGPTGPSGPTGPAGPPGIGDIYVRSANISLAPGGWTHTIIDCDPGDLATGGGYYLNDRDGGTRLTDAQRDVEVFVNGPINEYGAVGLGWVIGIDNMSDGTPRTGTGMVVCADITP